MKLGLHFVVDPMGWLCVSAVFGVWLYNSFFVPKLVLFPHYREGHIPWVIVICKDYTLQKMVTDSQHKKGFKRSPS